MVRSVCLKLIGIGEQMRLSIAIGYTFFHRRTLITISNHLIGDLMKIILLELDTLSQKFKMNYAQLLTLPKSTSSTPKPDSVTSRTSRTLITCIVSGPCWRVMRNCLRSVDDSLFLSSKWQLMKMGKLGYG